MGSTQFRADGTIADPERRYTAGGELRMCLDVVIGGRPSRICHRPQLSGQGYRWRSDLLDAVESDERVVVRGADLSHLVVEKLTDCVVRETAAEKRITCTGNMSRQTYFARGPIAARLSDDLSDIYVPVHWDLRRPPDNAGPERQVVDLAGRGIKDGRGRCLPVMGSTGGWLAADGGRTIPLPNNKSIHLFGDTLIGPVDANDRRGQTFVGNSVGIGECIGGTWVIRYVWKDDGDKREAIFDPKDGKTRVWPVDGFFQAGKLHVVLAKILHVDTGLGFDYAGSLLATVHNPLEHPARWRIHYAPLTPAGPFRPGRGITVHGGWVYIFGANEAGDYPHPGILMRLPANALDVPDRRVEFLARDGWRPMSQISAQNVRVIVPRTSPNMYVHYHSGLRKWITIHADPTFGSPDMILRMADRMEGPWTEGTVVYKFPEMLDRRNSKLGVICYAVTEHPQLRRERDHVLVVTYACNTLSGPLPTKEHLHLYYPKTVTIDLREIRGF